MGLSDESTDSVSRLGRHLMPGHCVHPDFSLSVFIRMLYSCLVDGHFLDTEQFMSKRSGESMEIFFWKSWEVNAAKWKQTIYIR